MQFDSRFTGILSLKNKLTAFVDISRNISPRIQITFPLSRTANLCQLIRSGTTWWSYQPKEMRSLAFHLFADGAKPLGGLGDKMQAVAAAYLAGWFGEEAVFVWRTVAQKAGVCGVEVGFDKLVSW